TLPWLLAVMVFWLALPLLLIVPGEGSTQQSSPAPSLKGKFLVADPSMPDPRFQGTVIFMIAHSPEQGAVGIVINRPAGRRTVGELLRAFGMPPGEGQGSAAELDLFWGGAVEGGRVAVVRASGVVKRGGCSGYPCRHSGDCAQGGARRQRARARAPAHHLRGRICGLVAGPARARAGAEELGGDRWRSRTAVRCRPRGQIRAGLEDADAG